MSKVSSARVSVCPCCFAEKRCAAHSLFVGEFVSPFLPLTRGPMSSGGQTCPPPPASLYLNQGLPYMTSTKFWHFKTPHHSIRKINALFVPKFGLFSDPPLPLLCVRHIWKPPQLKCQTNFSLPPPPKGMTMFALRLFYLSFRSRHLAFTTRAHKNRQKFGEG